eukprot:9474030-Pyramimonas_sp.AAC.1
MSIRFATSAHPVLLAAVLARALESSFLFTTFLISPPISAAMAPPRGPDQRRRLTGKTSSPLRPAAPPTPEPDDPLASCFFDSDDP